MIALLWFAVGVIVGITWVFKVIAKEADTGRPITSYKGRAYYVITSPDKNVLGGKNGSN